LPNSINLKHDLALRTNKSSCKQKSGNSRRQQPTVVSRPQVHKNFSYFIHKVSSVSCSLTGCFLQGVVRSLQSDISFRPKHALSARLCRLRYFSHTIGCIALTCNLDRHTAGDCRRSAPSSRLVLRARSHPPTLSLPKPPLLLSSCSPFTRTKSFALGVPTVCARTVLLARLPPGVSRAV